MSKRCAIFAPGGVGLPSNPFGKDIANIGLYRALSRYGCFDDICFLLQNFVTPDQLMLSLFEGRPSNTRVSTASLMNVSQVAAAGTLLRGNADLADLAWWRRQAADDRAYSLVGLVHCIAPPALRRYIADAAIAPIQPWDALICTSPVVRDNLTQMYEAWSEHLCQRFAVRSSAARKPQLPVIPLGVEAGRFAAAADRPAVRTAMRTELGISTDDILVLWVGRLSFFEKAFPQPMFRTLEEAAARSQKQMRFVMAGWFPNGEASRRQFEEAAVAYAPSVPLTLLDGTDAALVERLWAASDIFMSLVDNIQETFGITPVEAMAAGLPVVVSDWDGYRSTVEHGIQGFLIETLGGPKGLGNLMLQRHIFGMDSYQNYVGVVAQHTAVNIGRAAEALAALASDPALRRRMGAAGRERVRTTFDWPVIVDQMQALFSNLMKCRVASLAFEGGDALSVANPIRREPFNEFSGFATIVMQDDLVLTLGAAHPAMPGDVTLDRFAEMWRAGPAETMAVLAFVAQGRLTVGELLDRFPDKHRKAVQASLMWLCKLGFLDWSVASPTA